MAVRGEDGELRVVVVVPKGEIELRPGSRVLLEERA